MLRATLKSLLARKIRLVLSMLAVIVGVSFVTGTLVLTDTLNKTFDTLFANVNKNVSVDVRAVNQIDPASDAGRPPLPATIVATVAGVDGVRAAVGTVTGQAVLIDPTTGKPPKTGAPGIGQNWTGAQPTATERIVEGHAPGPGEIVVDKASARKLHLTVGGKVSVQTKAAPVAYTLAGTFEVPGQDGFGGASVTAFDTATAQRLLLAPNQFSAVHIAAADGLGQQELRTRVAAALPAGIEAITGEQLADESASAIQQAIGGFSIFLLVFAAISVFVGAFIIFNTFTMLVAQRVRELALLRAIGASRRQVQVSLQVEAAVVGTAGATAGLVVGAGLAVLLRAAVGAFGVDLPNGALVFAPRTIVVAYAVGVVITCVAAYIPARKAASVPPVAAMRETFVLPARSLRLRAIAGCVLSALGVLLLVAGTASAGKTGAIAVGVGAAGIFLGVATLSPQLSSPVIRVLGVPFISVFGTTGRLGRENAMRNPRRTASTASALMIGLALVSAFSILGQSIKESVSSTVKNSLGADFYLTTQGFGTGFSGQVVRDLSGQPGIDVATGLRGGAAKVNDHTIALLAGDPAGLLDVLAIKKVAGDINALGDGTILAESTTAKNEHLTVGQKVKVAFADGTEELTLAGTYKKSQVAGSWIVSTAQFARHNHDDLDQFVLIKRAAGADPAAVRAEIDKVVKPFGTVEVRDQSEFVAQQEKQVDQLLGFIYVLLALAVIIALFGIVNTLALSVIERTREIGLLRAIGMSRGQMRAMVVMESTIISVFGAVLGVAVGSVFGWALTKALASQGINTFAYPTSTIIMVIIVGVLLGILAAVFPARRAARMDVLRAISTA
ncbi:ABC transporter permease [Frankia sp. AgKG'84/4]|uniref:ABC transporter permease n=1 Tax=Frankia sp. AgKG'84/4 TaxID=573490 RepID=UPI00200DB9C8|nr:FtsX-like permease family protein [Frankia sp. AgKG'84/4]MCL9797372.1 FtsX-like permease family protein [Frankia sp. AgKG'84/4]